MPRGRGQLCGMNNDPERAGSSPKVLRNPLSETLRMLSMERGTAKPVSTEMDRQCLVEYLHSNPSPGLIFAVMTAFEDVIHNREP